MLLHLHMLRGRQVAAAAVGGVLQRNPVELQQEVAVAGNRGHSGNRRMQRKMQITMRSTT